MDDKRLVISAGLMSHWQKKGLSGGLGDLLVPRKMR